MIITKWTTAERWFQRIIAYCIIPIYTYSLLTREFLWYRVLFEVIITALHVYLGIFIDLKTFYLRKKFKPGDIIENKKISKFKKKNNLSNDPYLVLTKGYILSLKHYEIMEEYKKNYGSTAKHVIEAMEKDEIDQLEKLTGEESWKLIGQTNPKFILPFIIRIKNEKVREELKNLLKELL